MGKRLPPSIVCLALFLAHDGLSQSTPEQRRRDDLRFVVNGLPARHPNLNAVNPLSLFSSTASALEVEAPSLTDEQFYTRLASLVALARDAHTSIRLDSAQAAQMGFIMLPVLLRWFDDGIFVTAASQEFIALNGAKLLDVGGLTTDAVIERLRPTISYENDWWFRSRVTLHLRNLGVLRGLGLAPREGLALFTFRLMSGETRTVELSASTAALVRPAQQTPGFTQVTLRALDRNYWAEYWPEHRAVYVAYRVCQEMQDLPIAQFAQQVVALVSANPVDTFIFDLRGNSGGASSVFTRFLEDISSIWPRLIPNKKFRAFNLIDRGTFSSGMLAAVELKRPVDFGSDGIRDDGAPLLTTLGEPTGGKPRSYGEVLSLTLPASRLTLQYSTRLFSPPSYIPDTSAVEPDIHIPLRSTDYFARHDPYLAAVFARGGKAPDAPSGDVIVVNSASFRTESGIAPQSFASAFGRFPAGALDVQINGAAAETSASTSSQIVFRVPVAAQPGLATIEVKQGSSTVAQGKFTISTAGPGLFVMDLANPAQPGAVLNQDSALNKETVRAARDSILQIFGTGHGPVNSDGRTEASVWIAQQPAGILFSGPAPGIPGLWQINARVSVAPPIRGLVPLFVAAHRMVSNAVTVWVE